MTKRRQKLFYSIYSYIHVGLVLNCSIHFPLILCRHHRMKIRLKYGKGEKVGKLVNGEARGVEKGGEKEARAEKFNLKK